MIRARVEKQVGLLSDEAWKNTCTIVTNTLIARRNCKIRNNRRQLMILCLGVADAIIKGKIGTKGMSA
ncbi:MAG: hypothetical protein ACYDG2_12235 [Ruminiclostridium sp.]